MSRRSNSAKRGVAVLFLLLLSALGPIQLTTRGSKVQSSPPDKSDTTRYRIDLNLDFDTRTYSGTQQVHWVNKGSSSSVVYFHLYPNLRPRPDTQKNQAQASNPDLDAPDEPRLEVTSVRATRGGASLPFVFEDGGVTMRVQLREPVSQDAAIDIELTFSGSIPEIDPDETSLSAHVVQQVGAAMRETSEVRRARDINFVSRGVMLLGSFNPVLAARVGNEWRRKAEATIGDTVFTDSADYEVNVAAPDSIAIYGSTDSYAGAERDGRKLRQFIGQGLRGFALIAGRSLRSAEANIDGTKVRSIFVAEHEKVGRRMLAVASDATRLFTARFGALPLKTVSVTEAPLVAGLGSTEFAGIAVIASAFYVDFESPQMRNFPEIVREQRASFEDSLEFAVAQGVAHEWWGGAVGSDPEKVPVLDEGLAHWSALFYYQEAHGAERAKEAEDEQLRGVYQIYRTFGGEDMPAATPSSALRNSFQYGAIVASKGAMMFSSLRQLLGDDRFFKALRLYYELNRLKIADLENLREELFGAFEVHQRRILVRTLNRWLNEKHGDEDLSPPDPQLAAVLGATREQPPQPRDRNAFSRLGRFFWRQMTRIR